MVPLRDADRDTWRGWSIRLAGVWAAASVALALLGPFQVHYGAHFLDKLVFWGGVVAAGLALASGLQALLRRWPILRGGWADFCVGLVVALILGPGLWVASQRGDPVTVSGLSGLAEVMGTVLALCLCVALLLVNNRPAAAGAAGAIPPVVRPAVTDSRKPKALRPPFLNRVDQYVPGDLLWVSADDHYLHVQTEAAQARVFMRFRDALQELAHLPGFQIHRSHWVAAHAVLRVRAEGRRYVMDLSDGTVLPVSQSYLEPLRIAGLYDPRGMGSMMGGAPSKMAVASGPMSMDSSGAVHNRPPV